MSWPFCATASSSGDRRSVLIAADKIMSFGADYKFVEGVCAHAAMARENVAAVLAEKVLTGYCTEEDAAAVARKVLRENAMAV